MWIIIFALPNLNLNESIGNENIAIVPHNDSRIIEITEKSSYAKALVENFKDQFGRKVYPSLLIISDKAPEHVKNIDSIVGFRNIVALFNIIKGHEHSLTSTFVAFPLYSDYFDFYPITIIPNDGGFSTQSPSLFGYDDECRKFTGQISPGLAGLGHVRVETTGDLFDQLHKVWKRRYLRKRYSEWSTRVLFRSLEMAYQATTMPLHSTIYDYGASASLWVSAFEILSHPQRGSVNLLTVLDLIGKYDWLHKELKRRSYVVKYRGTKKYVNLAQKLYKELYDTRNAFLHGNPVTANRLRPFGKKNAQVITRFAPLLYKVALLNYLTRFKDKRTNPHWQKDYIQRSFNERNLTEGLLKAKSP
ncbi:MAG: hypothetical protein GXP46_13420 [Deferribacteres bacterium]|nr:hypothetical protein [Deferribacteres bacterium]